MPSDEKPAARQSGQVMSDLLEGAKRQGFAKNLDKKRLREIAENGAKTTVGKHALDKAYDEILAVNYFAKAELESLSVVPPSIVEKKLNALKTQTVTLIESLEKLPLDAEEYIWRATAGHSAMDRLQRFSEFMGALHGGLHSLEGPLARALREARANKTKKHGTEPKNAARRNAISDLKSTYIRMTGEDPGLVYPNEADGGFDEADKRHYGLFRDFCVTCLTPVFGDWAATGIEHDIQKVLYAFGSD